MQYWLVVPAAGAGRRFGGAVPKQYQSVAGRALLHWALLPFAGDARCRGLAVALAADDAHWRSLRPQLDFATVIEAPGGRERSQSVANALAALAARAQPDDWVLVHDAARPCVGAAEINSLLATGARSTDGALLALPMADTVKLAGEPAAAAGPAESEGAEARVVATRDRARLWRAQTPQMFRYGALRSALATAHAAGRFPSDEAQAIEWAGGAPLLVPDSPANLKLTTAADLALATALLQSRSVTTRIGFGTDVHAFGPGDHVMLGGVRVPHERGVRAHSDGDVILHALCDALLGCAALGDIGQHFPDSDPRWRGAASREFVIAVRQMLAARGLAARHVDVTLLAEAPRLGAYRDAIRDSIASLLGLGAQDVNVKATTTEKLGYLGRGEGLMAEAVVLAGPLLAGPR